MELLDLAVMYEEPELRDAVAWALSDVSAQGVQAHGRALKRHQEHPEVGKAYEAFLTAVSWDRQLLDVLF